ncbi:MAG TPA: hypothetical protein VEG31_02740 [Thermoproteota archaeon]|nr:hypothetical protein [Thermoproteota archaeon]
MAAQKEQRSILDLIGNAFLYLSILGFAGGIAILGVTAFFENDLLLYGSHIALLLAVLVPCFPFTSKESYQRFLSRGAGGLLIVAAVAAVQFAFLPSLKLSTLLTTAVLAVAFVIGWTRTVQGQDQSGLVFRLLELIGAGLTAFGAVLEPILVRLGVASGEGLGLYGIPLVLVGMALLVYVRFFSKQQGQSKA